MNVVFILDVMLVTLNVLHINFLNYLKFDKTKIWQMIINYS